MSRTRVPVVAALRAGLAMILAAGRIEAAVTVSFQEGVNGYAGTVDTMIRQAAPATAYAADTSVGWDTDDPSGTGLYNYVLIRFEGIFGAGPGQIPAGSAITSATLSYYVFNTGNSGNVNEVVVDWAEDVTYNTFGGDAGVQADEYGAARGSAPGAAGTNNVDVTASLAAWVNNPSANRGWIIRPTGTDGVDFYTREYATISQRPKLTVTYTPLNSVSITPGRIDTVVGKADVPITVAIPAASNASGPVTVTLTTNNAAVAVPLGAVGGSLTLTFPQGGAVVQSASIDIGSAGSAAIVTANDAGLIDATLPVNVTVGAVTFDPPFVAMPTASIPVRVSISPGSNETRSVQVTLTSHDPAVAVPVGAVGGSLLLTFPQGGASQQSVTVQTLAAGDTAIDTTNDGGVADASLSVHAIVGFHFTLTADPRSVVSEWQTVLAAIKAKLGEVGAFHITAGDLDPPAPLRSALDAQFGPSTIWYPCVGNHEAETSADMTWLRAEYTSGNGLRTPLKYFTNQDGPAGAAETTYSWDYGNAHFVMLNEYWNGGTAPGSDVATDGDIVPALYDWLAADLAATRKPALFVIGHEPAFPFNGHVGDSLDKYPAHRDAFWTLLENSGVHAFLVGHTHVYSKYQKTTNRTWQIDAGTAGNDDPPRTFVNILVSATAVEYYVWNNAGGTFQLAENWSAPVVAVPRIQLNKTTMTASARQLSSPPDDTFTVQNSGKGTLRYEVSDDADWLRVAPPDGTSDGEEDVITVHYDAAALPPGQRTATITVTDTGGTAAPASIAVTLTITAFPEDFDADGDVDPIDFGWFQTCFNGPNRLYRYANCDVTDLDADHDVDLADFSLFQDCFNGPNRPPKCL